MRISYANVTSSLALFIALGGTSYAAVQLGKNQVKGKNIASGQIASRHIQGGAVTSKAIRDKSVRLSDLNPEIATAKGVLGPAGKDGKDGKDGAAGAAGRDGAAVGDLATFTTPPLVRRTVTSTPPVLLYEHSWTQPANTLDEVTGFASVNWTAVCAASNGVEAQVAIVVDGQLVSPSGTLGSKAGNPVLSAAPTYDQLVAMSTTGPGAVSTATTDFANFPFERAQYLTGASEQTHALQLYGRSTCSGMSEPTLSGTIIVRRFAR